MNYCKKRSFDSILEAKSRLKEIKENSEDEVNFRVYECPFCQKYHFTSMEQIIFNNIRDKNIKIHEYFIHRESKYWSEKFNEEFLPLKFKKKKKKINGLSKL